MKFKELRKNKGATQEEVAKMLNVVKSTYNGYENGNSEPTIATLCKLADYYNVTLDYLCEHETKGVIDLSSFSELKKGCVYVLEKLSENNTAIVLGYMTHILQEQSK